MLLPRLSQQANLEMLKPNPDYHPDFFWAQKRNALAQQDYAVLQRQLGTSITIMSKANIMGGLEAGSRKPARGRGSGEIVCYSYSSSLRCMLC